MCIYGVHGMTWYTFLIGAGTACLTSCKLYSLRYTDSDIGTALADPEGGRAMGPKRSWFVPSLSKQKPILKVYTIHYYIFSTLIQLLALGANGQFYDASISDTKWAELPIATMVKDQKIDPFFNNFYLQ